MIDSAPDYALEAARTAFDRSTPYRGQFKARLTIFVLKNLYLLAPIVYLIPRAVLGDTLFAFGFDDAQSVLSNEAAFPLPFTARMAELDSTGEVSVLGFTNDADYRRNICQIMRALPMDDLPAIARRVAAQAGRIIADHPANIDALRDLLSPITLAVAQAYFGLTFSDPDAAHRWTMAISNYTFGSGTPEKALKTAADSAALLLDAELNAAIARAHDEPAPPGTLLRRLIDMRLPDENAPMTDGQLRATIAGLLSGFLPNVPTAGSNVLQVLLNRPAAMRIARAAAEADDDEGLRNCIMEALRFRPIMPGPQRFCIAENAAGLVETSWFAKFVPTPTRACAVTVLAMFDGRRVQQPFVFDPDRPASDNLAFGFGKHWCVGAPLALCILVQTLKPLLRQPELRRDRSAPPPLLFLGFFQRNLELHYAERKS